MVNNLNVKKHIIISVSLIITISLSICLFIINKHPNQQNICDLKINYINYEHAINKNETKSVPLSQEYVKKIENFLKTNNNGILIKNTTENIQINRELLIGSNKHLIRITNNINNKNKFIIEFYSGSLLDNFTDSISNNDNAFKKMQINSDKLEKIFEELKVNEN